MRVKSIKSERPTVRCRNRYCAKLLYLFISNNATGNIFYNYDIISLATEPHFTIENAIVILANKFVNFYFINCNKIYKSLAVKTFGR